MAGRRVPVAAHATARLLICGLTYKTIAGVLGRPPRTVKYHAAVLFEAFHVHDRDDLAAAIRHDMGDRLL